MTAPKGYPCPHPHCERRPAYNLGGCMNHMLQLPLPLRDRFTKLRLRQPGDPRPETREKLIAAAVAYWTAYPDGPQIEKYR